MPNLSKTQIDRLGDRLRQGSPTEVDLRLLDDYRLSFGEAYDTVLRTVRDQLKLEPTGRPAKSTSSIVEKLNRETIRLSQVQDVAGCRVVVGDVTDQDRVVASLRGLFPQASVVDRRTNPSYGYRAVHVVAQISGKLIETQVRTRLQHRWAELSEKLSDVVDPAIKYGGGASDVRQMLSNASARVAASELDEKQTAQLRILEPPLGDVEKAFELAEKEIAQLQEQHGQIPEEVRAQMPHPQMNITDLFNQAISLVENQKEQKR